VRVTHPFHPLSGRQFACVGERYNRYGKRLLLRVDDENVCSVLPQWTDMVAPDPEVELGGGRALLRLGDLLGLADLVVQLRQSERAVPRARKANSAADVKRKVPRGQPKRHL
jgi:hypothetical protein